MILSTEEYYALGFSAEDTDLLESCLKRAEYVLNGLSDGKASAVAAAGGKPAEYVKQACGFQAQALVKEQSSRTESASSSESSEGSEKVTVGDFSYSTSTGSSSSNNSSSGTEVVTEAIETNTVVVHLLRTAGCLFGGYGGMEVRE